MFNLPPTTAAVARRMFKINSDKLQVLEPGHKQFKGSHVKAGDYVIAVNGTEMDPQDLLNACVSDEVVELKLHRDRHFQQRERERVFSAAVLFVLLQSISTFDFIYIS